MVVGDEGDYVNQFTDYKQLQRGIPYIIGFPGERYYEFDLSGNFKAQNTYGDIKQLDQQVITFASKVGAEINVSDTELNSATGGTVTANGYTFKAQWEGTASMKTE